MVTPDQNRAQADAWNPAQYERFRNERTQPFHDLVSLVEPLPGMRAIDLGCGTGELTRIMHDVLGCASTVGLDQSSAMLARTVGHASPDLTFVTGDIANLDLTLGPFDLIFSNAALHWLRDHGDLLPRLVSRLAPGGQLAVQVPANADHASHVIAASIAREEPFRTELQGHVRIFGTMSPEWYAETLFKLGAKSTHVRLQVYGHALADTGSVVEWVRGSLLTDYQSRLSPDSFEGFLDRYHDRLIDTLGAHAPYYYAFKRILFCARF